MAMGGGNAERSGYTEAEYNETASAFSTGMVLRDLLSYFTCSNNIGNSTV